MNKKSQTFALRRVGQFLEVCPPCEELRLALRTSVHVPRPHGQGIGIDSEPGPLYREVIDVDRPVLECFVGLLPVVEKVLASAGYDVQKDFAVPAPMPLANMAEVSRAGTCDQDFLDMVRLHDRGLIRYVPAGVEPAWLIAQVALAWPTSTVAVAATRIEDTQRLQRRHLRYMPNVMAITSRDTVADDCVGRVVVATYNGLGHTGIEIEKRDIIVVLDAAEASRVEPLSRLGHARRARVYGLLPWNHKLAPHDEDIVRLLFGFEETTVQRHGVPTTKIEVVRLPNDDGQYPENAGLAYLKSVEIWQNEIRNRRIARLANQLTGDDYSELEQGHPVLGTALKGRSGLAVLVLVENIAHGKELVRQLPGWPFIAKGQSWLTVDIKGSWDLRPFAPMPPDKRLMYAIVTWQGVQTLNCGGWDVVIRADGGVGLPPFMEQATGTPIIYGINNLPDQIIPSLILVDFDDRSHQILRRWSRQRRIAYDGQGWYAPGVDPVQARIDRFLAARQKPT